VHSVSEHCRSVLQPVKPCPVVEVPIGAALGHALGLDVVATVPVPRFNDAAMDGYAVCHQDLANGSTDLPVG
jgi:molybdopterin molybdotransferase